MSRAWCLLSVPYLASVIHCVWNYYFFNSNFVSTYIHKVHCIMENKHHSVKNPGIHNIIIAGTHLHMKANVAFCIHIYTYI